MVEKLEKKLQTTEFLKEENNKLNEEQCAILCDEMLIVNDEWEQKLADARREHEKALKAAEASVEEERKEKDFTKVQLRKTIAVLDRCKKEEHSLAEKLNQSPASHPSRPKFVRFWWILVVCIFLRLFLFPLIEV